MALLGYQAEKTRIETAIAEIRAQLGHRGPGRPKAATDGKVDLVGLVSVEWPLSRLPANRPRSGDCLNTAHIRPKTGKYQARTGEFS